MPGFLTDLVNNQVLDCFFGGSAIVPPRQVYLGLSLARAYRGGHVVEPWGGSYARVAVPNDPDHFPPSSGGRKSNATPITFPEPDDHWGEIRSVFVADAPSGGNVLAMADLPSPRIMCGGLSAATISVGALLLSHS